MNERIVEGVHCVLEAMSFEGEPFHDGFRCSKLVFCLGQRVARAATVNRTWQHANVEVRRVWEYAQDSLEM